MKLPKPSVLLLGVIVCVPLLALHRFGLFKELSDVLARHYHENLRLTDELRPLPLLQYGYYTLLAFLSAWVCLELPKQFQRFAFIVGLCFLTATLSAVLALNGVLFEPFSGMAAILAAGLLGIAFSGSERGRRVHVFRDFFVERLSGEAFDRLVQDREPVKLTGKHEVTTLSCRLLNNDELAEGVEADALEQMNSAFLKSVSEFLVARGAYLDACHAQGITVQIGFPVAEADHALTACQLALELNEHLTQLTEEFDKRWQRRPLIGVGVASGPVSGGLMGYGTFQFYSVLGEAPELSRRLCGLNGLYGSRLLIAASTFAKVKEAVEVRPMELLTVPGKSGMREVYELLAAKDQLSPVAAQARDAFWLGVVALRQGDGATALQKLQQAVIEGIEDAPLRYFQRRAEAAVKAAPAKEHVRQSDTAA